MATKLEKNIRKIIDHPDAELVESTFGAFYQLKGYCIATGAGYGGCAHRRAKQVWYAVIKIDDAD